MNKRAIGGVLLLMSANAFAQFKPISHALRITFDVKPQSSYQAAFEGIRVGTAIWDYKTTKDFLRVGNCTESNPLMGKNPSNARLLLIGGAFEFGVTRLDNFLQERIQSKDDKIAASAFLNGTVALAHGLMAHHNQNGVCQ